MVKGEKEMLKKIKYPKVLICSFLVIAAAYCGLLHIHFATDTYQNMETINLNWQLVVGRYSIFVLGWIFEIIGIPMVQWQSLFMFLTIILLSLSSYTVFKLLYNDNDEKGIIYAKVITSLICVVNVFVTELFLFPEYVIYNGLGIYLAVLSTSIICNKISIKGFFMALAILIVSLGFYQANIGIFLILSLGYVCLNRRKLREIIYIISSGAFASLAVIAIQRYLVSSGLIEGTDRNAKMTLQTVINNLKFIMFGKEQGQFKIIYEGADLLPKGILLFTIIIFLVSIIITIIRDKDIRKGGYVLFFVITGYFAGYAPHLIAGGIWMSPRTIYPLFFYVGVLGIVAIQLSDKVILQRIISIVAAAFFAINFWAVQGIVVNHFSTNKIDQNYAHDIYSEIERYESETGVEIKNIAPQNDMIPLWKNHFVDYYSFNMNERAFLNEWSDVTLINYVSGRSFNRIPMDEKIFGEYFQNKDWDYYSPEEQLVFIDDTLYWCKY